jgi:hypothetical protein
LAGSQKVIGSIPVTSTKWCNNCVGGYIDNKICAQIAKEKGGRLISGNVQNKSSGIRLECKEGHTWETTAAQLERGRWCPYCAGKRKDISLFQKIAKDRGGKCLSRRYKSYNSKLKFECGNGHKFESAPVSIEMGSWCSTCSESFGERATRAAFEQIFKRKFKKAYPKWLVNSDGYRMELDGYNEDLRLAFEHQGIQHYKPHRFFSDEDGFKKRVKDDKAKLKLCKENGVTLIQIRRAIYETPVDQLVSTIIAKLPKRLKGKIKSKTSKISLRTIYSVDLNENIKEFAKLAKAAGYKLHDKQYLGTLHKYNLTCPNGHRTKISFYNFKAGRRCATCAGYNQTVQDMQKLAKSKGGKFLSKTLGKIREKHEWECEHGHRWFAAPYSVKSGSWCRVCNVGEFRGLEDLVREAKNRGGKCLSKQWYGMHRKHDFRCKQGHNFSTTPTKLIHRGQWCKKCALVDNGLKRRLATLEGIKKDANRLGGKCTSNEFNGPKTELKFVCKKGHRFKMPSWKFKRGYWCPKC